MNQDHRIYRTPSSIKKNQYVNGAADILITISLSTTVPHLFLSLLLSPTPPRHLSPLPLLISSTSLSPLPLLFSGGQGGDGGSERAAAGSSAGQQSTEERRIDGGSPAPRGSSGEGPPPCASGGNSLPRAPPAAAALPCTDLAAEG